MPVTISTHNGTAVAREHNIRNEKVVRKEKHINPNGIYEIWIDEPIRQEQTEKLIVTIIIFAKIKRNTQFMK